MDFAELRAVMARQGVKNSELAEHIGISNQAFYNKMSGKSDFKLSEVCAIATALGMTSNEVADIFLPIT